MLSSELFTSHVEENINNVANIISLWAKASGILPFYKISATMQITFSDVHTFSTSVYITSSLMSDGKVKVQFVSDF